MLKVTLKSPWPSAAICTHYDGNAGVGKYLEIAHGDGQMFLKPQNIWIMQYCILFLGIFQLGYFGRVGLLQEESIAEKGRRLRVSKYSHLAGQRWTVKGVALLHQVSKFRVNLAVADAMGDVVGSGAEHTLGVIE